MTRAVAYQSQPVQDISLTVLSANHKLTRATHGGHMQIFIRYMRTVKLSNATIRTRIELLARLQTFLGDVKLADATAQDLRGFQETFGHLAPASVHVYTRHLRAFYLWARRNGYIEIDPAVDLELPRLRKTRPHPTTFDDLKLIFACAQGRLRTAYLLATFAGLRCGEICAMHSDDLYLETPPTALIHGKGGKERIMPLLPSVVSEIGYRRGWVIQTADGRQVRPDLLSADSTRFLHQLGTPTTLHSMRAAFATNAARLTHDPLLVRDLLGHESVKTTEIYMESSLIGAHERLIGFGELADSVLTVRHLSIVRA